MSTPSKNTWFIVADGAKALVFQSAGARAGWTLIHEWRDAARVPDRDLGRDRPIRGRTIGTGAPFAIDAPSLHDAAERAFIEERAVFLNAAAAKNSFGKLVLAAAPKALGILRKALGPEASSRVIAVFDKDLTKTPGDELLKYFVQRLERW